MSLVPTHLQSPPQLLIQSTLERELIVVLGGQYRVRKGPLTNEDIQETIPPQPPTHTTYV